MKFFSKEVKIAVVAIAGIIILFLGMNFLKGISLFTNDHSYYIKFKNIVGLSASNPIFADGYQVGVVKEIQYDYEGNGDIIVKFDVDNNLRIPKGSSAEISSDLMGNVKMNLLLANNPRERVNPGDTIVGNISVGMLGTISTLLPTIQNMLPKLDSILMNLNTLLADPAIAQSLHNIKTVTANLGTSTQEVNTLLAGLNKRVPVLMNNANTTLENTSKLTNNLAAVDVAGTMAQVNQTLSNVSAFTSKLNNNEGSLGLLMNDPTLYNRLNTTVSSADSLLVNLRQNPKRYVHFSLFGKKDK